MTDYAPDGKNEYNKSGQQTQENLSSMKNLWLKLDNLKKLLLLKLQLQLGLEHYL